MGCNPFVHVFNSLLYCHLVISLAYEMLDREAFIGRASRIRCVPQDLNVDLSEVPCCVGECDHLASLVDDRLEHGLVLHAPVFH